MASSIERYWKCKPNHRETEKQKCDLGPCSENDQHQKDVPTIHQHPTPVEENIPEEERESTHKHKHSSSDVPDQDENIDTINLTSADKKSIQEQESAEVNISGNKGNKKLDDGPYADKIKKEDNLDEKEEEGFFFKEEEDDIPISDEVNDMSSKHREPIEIKNSDTNGKPLEEKDDTPISDEGNASSGKHIELNEMKIADTKSKPSEEKNDMPISDEVNASSGQHWKPNEINIPESKASEEILKLPRGLKENIKEKHKWATENIKGDQEKPEEQGIESIGEDDSFPPSDEDALDEDDLDDLALYKDDLEYQDY